MTKPKTWADLASLDADWPPHQPITLMDLVAGARAVDWDFTTWCYVSDYEASDPDARHMFECLLGLRQTRGPRRLELIGITRQRYAAYPLRLVYDAKDPQETCAAAKALFVSLLKRGIISPLHE
jgi:hypothetical protein